jgi:hypothetical protein
MFPAIVVYGVVQMEVKGYKSVSVLKKGLEEM